LFAKEYKKRFGKGIIEDLKSLSTSYGTINFCIDPFVELDFCFSNFQHKVKEE